MVRRLVVGLVLVLAACGGANEPAGDKVLAGETYQITGPLEDVFDCVRKQGGVLIAAHRGGPGPGAPENSFIALEETYAAGVRVFELDVATSRDGVLFLMHDSSLTRTTTGRGRISDRDWSQIAALRLVDEAGQVTRASPPKLSDVLDWAVSMGAVLELDRKGATSWSALVGAVKAAGAEDYVVIITYSDDEAARVHALAPDLMVTAGARGSRDVERLRALGVRAEKIIGWTGTRAPDPAAWSRLQALGIEPAFGTLGRPSERLDEVYLADGDASEYETMVREGLVLLATDRPREIANLISLDDMAFQSCANKGA